MNTVIMLNNPILDVAQIIAEAYDALGDISEKQATPKQKKAYNRCAIAIKEIRLQKQKMVHPVNA